MPKKMLDKRSFKVSMSSFGIIGGRYISSTPSSAAKKAARILFRQADTTTAASAKSPTVEFELRETTRGSKDTVFAYRALRVKRTLPTTFIAKGQSFSINRTYDITVTAVTEQTMMRSITRRSNQRSLTAASNTAMPTAAAAAAAAG